MGECLQNTRLDFTLMPLLCLGFFALQLDRSNISNAMTSTITKDLGITSDEVNSGNQLQIAALIAFEIPSNIMLQRFGPPIWITFQSLAWGLVALFQAFVKNKKSFYATRFLLGMFEAGYMPGCQFIMASFYKRDELAMRTAIFYFGNYLATATGSLIAAGVLRLAGSAGLGGWQWLFISEWTRVLHDQCAMLTKATVDGLFTVLVGLIFLFFLPHGPHKTTGLVPVRCLDVFNDRDRHILHTRVIVDDPHKEVDMTDLKPAQILAALVDYRLWCHFFINILSLAPKGGLQLYSPSIIKKLGFGTTRANALSSVSSYGVIVFSYLIAFASDRTKLRGPWSILATSYCMIFAGVQYGMTSSNNKWAKYAIFTLLGSGNALTQGLNDAWLSSNCRTPQHRSIGLAMVVMGSNIGGLAGQQLFRTSDAPKYTRGFLAILCLYAASLVLFLIQIGIYYLGNRRLQKEEDNIGQLGEDQQQSLGWRYEL